jgi:hypothetical protein
MRIEGDDDMNPDGMELVIEAGPMKQKPADCGLRIGRNSAMINPQSHESAELIRNPQSAIA